jgi:hypothetical protein
VKYRKGYKYQLHETFFHVLPFAPEKDIVTEYIKFNTDGVMCIAKGYAWDGASGPTIDDDTNMTPSLVHDAGYQLMREGLLPSSCRKLFDKALEHMCEERGMSDLRADYWYAGVHIFAADAAKPQQVEIFEAP